METWLADASDREAAEVARRITVYRPDRPLRELTGRTVIVVDDGVATGATAGAAGRTARQLGATRVVLGTPVIAPLTELALRTEYDAVVAVERAPEFFAVGQFYERFEQLSDEDVVAYLLAATRRDAAAAVEALATPPADPTEGSLVIPLDDPPLGAGELEADLAVPAEPKGLVVFGQGLGMTHHGARHQFVAHALQEAGLATLLFEYLTPTEAAEDAFSGRLRSDLRFLVRRLLAATRVISAYPRVRGLPLGYFAMGIGVAAALAAAVSSGERVFGIAAQAGRPDLVKPRKLRKVSAPVLLVVGARDEDGLRQNRAALPHLHFSELAVIPGATQHFDEPGTLGAATQLAVGWLVRHLPERATALGTPSMA